MSQQTDTPRPRDVLRPRRPRFSGTPDEWRYLVEAWGLDAVRLMRAGNDTARYSAALAARFARKGGLVE